MHKHISFSLFLSFLQKVWACTKIHYTNCNLVFKYMSMSVEGLRSCLIYNVWEFTMRGLTRPLTSCNVIRRSYKVVKRYRENTSCYQFETSKIRPLFNLFFSFRATTDDLLNLWCIDLAYIFTVAARAPITNRFTSVLSFDVYIFSLFLSFLQNVWACTKINDRNCNLIFEYISVEGFRSCLIYDVRKFTMRGLTRPFNVLQCYSQEIQSDKKVPREQVQSTFGLNNKDTFVISSFFFFSRNHRQSAKSLHWSCVYLQSQLELSLRSATERFYKWESW